ncbi:MAG: hypothetical protein ACRC6A_01355 [Fusobacteriaceae bacterium]
MSFQELKIISDRMIQSSDSSYFSLDLFKHKKGGGLTKFKDMDGLKIVGNIIDLVEFKDSTLFYKDELDENAEKIIGEILEALPQKISDSILALLPEYKEDFRTNSNYKINLYLVLGDTKDLDDQKSRGREREVTLRKTNHFKKLEKILMRYRGTSFVKNAEIMTRSKFIKKFNIVLE